MNTSLHILIVDDRPDTVLFLTEFLLSRDHRVETCSNGNEALEAIIRRHRTANAYDLLISDVSMPIMDGITLLKEIRRRQLLLPIALYTAFGSMHPKLIQEAHQLDCLAVLDKPIELRRIDTLISNVIARRDGTQKQHQDKDQPFFGTSRVARPSTDSSTSTSISSNSDRQRRETAHFNDLHGQIPNSYALEPKPSPLSLPIQPTPELPIPPPPIRTPSPFHITPTEPLTRGMSSFNVKSPLPSNPVPTSARTVNPSFRTPLPFLQSNAAENNLSVPPLIPPMVASARVVRTPQLLVAPLIASGSEETDSPPPKPSRQTTTFIRRGVNQASSQDTRSIRRGGDLSAAEENVSPPISAQTARLRRSVTGTYVPGTTAADQANPLTNRSTNRPATGNQSSRAVACAHCHKVFMVATRQNSYTAVCVHCAQLNRIDPL